MNQVVRHKTAQLAGLLILVLLAALAGSHPAFAQSVTVDLGAEDPGGFTGRIVQLVTLVTVLSLAPGLLVAVTSFTRIVVVLSLLRSALGVQQTPPNAVLIGLAMFLTGFVMTPTFERAWTEGVAPLVAEDITEFFPTGRMTDTAMEFTIRAQREVPLGNMTDNEKLVEVEISTMIRMGDGMTP